jgi:hypothetical protein
LDQKTLKNRSNDPIGHIFGFFTYFGRFSQFLPFLNIFGDFFT